MKETKKEAKKRIKKEERLPIIKLKIYKFFIERRKVEKKKGLLLTV